MKCGTLTSWNLLGHSRHVMGLLYLSLELEFDKVIKKQKERTKQKLRRILNKLGCKERMWIHLAQRRS
jgi:hypothetical protein